MNESHKHEWRFLTKLTTEVYLQFYCKSCLAIATLSTRTHEYSIAEAEKI